MTDFYCEFKERKQVAAIYDSYPLYSLLYQVLHVAFLKKCNVQKHEQCTTR